MRLGNSNWTYLKLSKSPNTPATINPKELKYTNFRDLLYDILIYDYNIGRLIFSILKTLFNQITHKVYHCNDTGKFPNWLINLF